MLKFLIVLVLASLLVWSGIAVAGRISRQSACLQLRSAAASAKGESRAAFYCVAYGHAQSYFVFQLHERVDPATVRPNWVGSDLVGYFGVSRDGSCIREWDVEVEQPKAPAFHACNH